MTVEGGCNCGAVRYSLVLDSLPSTYACHCHQCQRWSGSAFSQQALVPENCLAVSGPVEVYEKVTGDRISSQRVCGVCHARIYNTNIRRPGIAVVRAGTLDRSEDLDCVAHIYTAYKQRWVDIPAGTPSWPEAAPAEDFVRGADAEDRMTETMTGGCQCGRIRYAVEVHDDEAYLCHCRMCQRATGGVSIAFKNVKQADVTWEREPDLYASSPFARRGFCAACGTPLTFAFNQGSENMDLTVGSFDDPARFRPRHHFGAESIHEAWLDTRDLPRYRTDQHKPLVDRWMATVGKLPD